MNTFRNNPDGEENQQATKESASYIGGLKLKDKLMSNTTTKVSSDERWHNTGQETSKVIETIRDDRGMWIADCQRGSGQLIATAPQLLEALQECADWLCDANRGTDQWERGQKAIEVINQATRGSR